MKYGIYGPCPYRETRNTNQSMEAKDRKVREGW